MEQQTEKTVIQESSKSSDNNNHGKTLVQINRTFRSFLLSKKLWMTIFGLAVLWLAYWKEVNYLYSFALYPEATTALMIPAFIGLTRDFMVAFTAVVTSFLGIEGFITWRHGTESVVNQTASFVKEKIDSTSTNINIDAQFNNPELLERYADR